MLEGTERKGRGIIPRKTFQASLATLEKCRQEISQMTIPPELRQPLVELGAAVGKKLNETGSTDSNYAADALTIQILYRKLGFVEGTLATLQRLSDTGKQ